MDKQEFYLNQSLNHECFKLPERDKNYLLKNNYLNEYFTDEEKAQVRSNLGITPLLDELRELILAKVFDEEGNVQFDIEPHEDSYDRVLSSATIYKILQRYYTKNELDNQSETIFNLISEKANKNNTYTKEQIDEIVYGSTFANRIESIINSKISQIVENIPTKVSQLENDSEYVTQEGLSNYITQDDISEIRDAILQEFSSYISRYQEILVSGQNIKTINGQSILGSGNITIDSSNPITVDSETSTDSQNPVQNKAITSYIAQEISRLEQLLSNYQETLVNQSNIKSINNKSLLGSGNMQLYEVLTQEQYDSLDNISKDTLYLIIEQNSSKLGEDTFPLILG